MDVHRCRFVPFPPSPINALAFSCPSNPKGPAPPELRLAVGRANGNIEIWNPLNGIWVHETTFWGGKGRTIDALTWTQDPPETDGDGTLSPGRLRLFSIGHSTAVTEWDLARGVPLRNADSNHGDLWCIAAQPALEPQKKGNAAGFELESRHLAVGCDDGTVALLSTADERLDYKKTFAKASNKKSRVLSITFQDQNKVVAGCADGRIKIFDIRSGAQIRMIALGAGPKIASKQTLVWAVKCLPNGGLISGDSNGEIRWYDSKTYGHLQRIKSHKADIFSLEVSANGQMVFTGSMDRRTTVYKIVGGKTKGQNWAEAFHRRYHKHDVKAMAAYECNNFSTLVSGGVDTAPIILPIRQIGREYHRTLPSLPQHSPTCSSPDQRLLISWWDQEIRIWRILQNEGHADLNSNRKLVARMSIKGEEKISAAAISKDGKLLLVASILEIKLFRIRNGSHFLDPLRFRKIQVPASLKSMGVKKLAVSPDSRWVCLVTRDNETVLARIIRDPQGQINIDSSLVRLKRPRRKRRLRSDTDSIGALGGYERNISQVAFSASSNILVTGDIEGQLDSWLLRNHTETSPKPNGVVKKLREPQQPAEVKSKSDSSDDDDDNDHSTKDLMSHFGEQWIPNPAQALPILPSSPLILSFRPSIQLHENQMNGVVHHNVSTRHSRSIDLPNGEDRLLVITSDHQIFEYSVHASSLTDWSRRNPTSTFPLDFQGVKDRATNCVWQVDGELERLWVCGANWLWMFNLAQDFPTDPTAYKAESSDYESGSKSKPLVNGRVKSDENQTELALRGKKRKRKAKESGAGDEIRPDERNDGQAVALYTAAKQTEDSAESSSEDNQDEQSRVNLALQRRQQQHQQSEEPMDIDGGDGNANEQDDGNRELVQQEPAPIPVQQRSWWSSYKYRSILGMLELGAPGAGVPLEIALIERPSYETEQPDRFYGDQEWKNL